MTSAAMTGTMRGRTVLLNPLPPSGIRASSVPRYGWKAAEPSRVGTEFDRGSAQRDGERRVILEAQRAGGCHVLHSDGERCAWPAADSLHGVTPALAKATAEAGLNFPNRARPSVALRRCCAHLQKTSGRVWAPLVTPSTLSMSSSAEAMTSSPLTPSRKARPVYGVDSGVISARGCARHLLLIALVGEGANCVKPFEGRFRRDGSEVGMHNTFHPSMAEGS